MIRPALAMIFAAVACVLAVAGCGGSSGSGDQASASKTTSAISLQEFIKQADAICAEATKQVQAEFASYLKENNIKEIGQGGESPAEEKARQVEVIETIGIPALHRQQAEIRAIGLPGASDDKARVEAYLDAGAKSAEEGEANPALLYNSPQKVFAKSDKLAKELGFKVCGNR